MHTDLNSSSHFTNLLQSTHRSSHSPIYSNKHIMHTNLTPSSHSPIYSTNHIMHTDLNPSSHKPIYSPEHLHTSHARIETPHYSHRSTPRNPSTQTHTHTKHPHTDFNTHLDAELSQHISAPSHTLYKPILLCEREV